MDAAFAQGAAALEAGDLGAAERIFQAIVERDPAAHAAWLALAAIALRAGDTGLAVERAQRAVALERKNAEYLNQLGVAHGEQGDLRAAEQAFRRALKIKPAYAAAHHNLAKALQKQGSLAASLKEFERAWRLAPQAVEMQSSLCGMYRMHGDPARALTVLRAAAGDGMPQPALIPQFADCIADAEGTDAALAWLRKIVAAQPQSAVAHYAFAVMLLSAGEWREGWKHHLWRPHAATNRTTKLEGRRLVLHGEYGLGDVLFFLRFLPELRSRGHEVTLELPPQLAKLAPLLAGQIEIAAPGTSEHLVWLADLPSLLQAESTPPAFALIVNDETQHRVREKMAGLGPPPYLGLTWRAGTDLQRGPELGVDQRVLFKEIAPALLGQAVRGWRGTLVSLQRGPSSAELESISAAAAAPVHDLSAANEDLRDALGVLAALDDYVTVSNTNVHLRAGLGRTARVLVPNPPEWRWMRREGGSPWFPGSSVYRQPASRDWAGPLARLRQDLRGHGGF